MSALFAYPPSAAFGRVVPKSKIYDHTNATAGLKNKFVQQVDKIVWKYKLAPETVNLAAGRGVPEIEVLWLMLKTPDLHDDVLRAIDRAIPFPLVFELHFDGKIQMVAAFKRQSEADSAKWVVSEHFRAPWVPLDTKRQVMPVALSLAGLYEKLLEPLLPPGSAADEGLQKRVARAEEIRAKKRLLTQIQSRLAKEKQFNKRVAINAELRAVKKELDDLARGGAGARD